MILRRALVVVAACSLGTLAVAALMRSLPSTIDPRQLTATPPRPPLWWAWAVATSGRG